MKSGASLDVVVFGHYSGQGGTIGIHVPGRDWTMVQAAFRFYDHDLFGVQHDCEIVYGKGYPSVEDFLFVAKIKNNTNQDLVGELDNHITRVLIDEATAPPEFFIEYPPEWQSMGTSARAVWTSGRNAEYTEWIKATLDTTMKMPVRLEIYDGSIISPMYVKPVGSPMYAMRTRKWQDGSFGFWLYEEEVQ